MADAIIKKFKDENGKVSYFGTDWDKVGSKPALSVSSDNASDTVAEGKITLGADPTNDMDAVPKKYADALGGKVITNAEVDTMIEDYFKYPDYKELLKSVESDADYELGTSFRLQLNDGSKCKIKIIGINADWYTTDLENDVGSLNLYTLMVTDPIGTKIAWNEGAMTGDKGYFTSSLKDYVENTVINLFPDDLVKAMIPADKCDEYYDQSGNKQSKFYQPKIWPLSERELIYSYKFSNDSSRILGSGVPYWTRTIAQYDNEAVNAIAIGNDGKEIIVPSSSKYYTSIAFCI